MYMVFTVDGASRGVTYIVEIEGIIKYVMVSIDS